MIPAQDDRKPKNSTLSPGFTLIEMVVVLALIGLFAALVAPTVGGLGQAELRSSARQLAGTIRFVYHMAILNKKPYRICFDMESHSYSIQERSGEEYMECTHDMLKPRTLPNSVFLRDVRVMDRVCDTGPCEVCLYFTEYGYVEDATIHLTDEQGRSVYTLFTDPMTGRTIVVDQDIKREDYQPE